MRVPRDYKRIFGCALTLGHNGNIMPHNLWGPVPIHGAPLRYT
jgi:hypothetical protein